MHGVPPELDLSPLVGFRLDQIALGAFQIQLNFGSPNGYTPGSPSNESGHVSIEGAWELVDADGITVDSRHEPDDAGRPYLLHRLLQSHVTDWRVTPPDRFALIFDNGDTLHVIDETPEQYEYVSIHLPGSEGRGWYL